MAPQRNKGGNFLAATSGAGTAKRAVENNYLSVVDVENLIRELSKHKKKGVILNRF